MSELTDDERREGFRRAAANLAAIWDNDLADRLIAADAHLAFPDSTDDVLDFLGALGPLALTAMERGEARAMTVALVERNGCRWIWRNRTRLRVELAWVLRNF